jgi:hypothetical protein
MYVPMYLSHSPQFFFVLHTDSCKLWSPWQTLTRQLRLSAIASLSPLPNHYFCERWPGFFKLSYTGGVAKAT